MSDDAQALRAAAEVHDPWALISPICFREPLAPLTAAQRAGRAIRLAPVLSAFRALARRHDIMIVEGVGGLLAPLTVRLSVADLAKRLGLPLLLVTRPDLGTLNHTLLTVRWARHCGLSMAGIVVNQAQRPLRNRLAQVVHRTNLRALRRLTGLPVLGPLPFDAAQRRRAILPAVRASWLTRVCRHAALEHLLER